MTDHELTISLLRESREIIRSLYSNDDKERSAVSENLPIPATLEDAMRELRTVMRELLADTESPYGERR